MGTMFRRSVLGIAAMAAAATLTAGVASAEPSANGNGNGNAVGRPCAGCVGNADDRQPPGQTMDGTDGNAGYECDTNAGIGRSNPAHTGCSFDSGISG